MSGGAGNDKLYGFSGADTMVGGTGSNDILNGGDDVDTLNYLSDSGGVTASLATGTSSGGTSGNDTFSNFENLFGSQAIDTLTGNSGNNFGRWWRRQRWSEWR